MKLGTYDKCHFCKNYHPLEKNGQCVYSIKMVCDEIEGNLFEANKHLIVTKSREWDLSVGDIIALINLR